VALIHLDALYRSALRLTHNRVETEDLVQETCLRAFRSFHRFNPGTNCRAWLVTILQHVRSNRRRARQRSPLVDDPEDRLASTLPFIAPVPETLTDDEMLGALGRIPVQFQEVIVLCDVEELTYKEIADALAQRGIEVDRRRVEVAEPIKRLGEHKIHVRLHRDVVAELTIAVQAPATATA